MRSFWSRIRGKSPGLDKASERWRSTLGAAAQVPYYSRWKKELHRAQHATDAEARSEALLRLPVVELDYLFQHFYLFREKATVAGKPQDGSSLWPCEARIAVVSPWFHVGGGAKLLLKPELEELRRFAPEVIAGPADALEALATAGDWQQDNCLFAMTALAGVGTPLLSQSARLRLWRAFGVPVYVQLRGFQGELFARECEAHNGLHFDAANVIFQRRPSGELLLTSLGNTRHTVLRLATRLEASIETRICDCGLSSPRLMNLQAVTGRALEHALPSAPSLTALAAAVSDTQGTRAGRLPSR
ncbi:MAG TPA: hypothetical protein VFB63_02605 [Bryobacteraceae bacterium]|nr:hypothetical protein [Bryobacteraceae bacterium]